MRYPNIKKQITKNIKKHVAKKIKKPTRKTKLVSSLAAIAFVTAIGLCAYLPAALGNNLGISENGRSLTISRALAHANKPSFLAIFFIDYFLLIYLLLLRGPREWFVSRFALITISFGLVVSLLWVTTTSNENLHYIFAGIIFSSIFIFNIITFYLFYKSTRDDKALIFFLILFNVIVYLFLIIFAIFKGNPFDPDAFAAFEIFYALLFVCIMLFLGFY